MRASEVTEGFKLDPAKKRRWVRALRSGRYRQGKGYLCTYDERRQQQQWEMCCLGVYADVNVPGEWERNEGIDGDYVPEKWSYVHTLDKCDGTSLPASELPGEICSFLAECNDGTEQWAPHRVTPRWSFGRIANWIEKNL